MTAFFPGAGSFGSEFRSLVDGEPGAWVVRYPGRMGKDFGIPAESFDDVVTACAEQVTGRGEAVLFGHSFGAYVAYATASRLQQAGTDIAALVVTGANARLRVPSRAMATPSDTAEYLNDVDAEMLAGGPSDEWREIVVELAMHDLRLLARFDAPSVDLRCPILAARGDADPLTSDEGVREWEHATRGTFTARVFRGGHSDFLGSHAYASWFREAASVHSSQRTSRADRSGHSTTRTDRSRRTNLPGWGVGVTTRPE